MKLNKTYEIASFKALDDEGPGKFQAVVSVFGNVDLQGDRVMPGAFKASLDKWRRKGDPIPVIWSHDWLNPEAHIGFVNPEDAVELIDAELKADGIPTGGLLVKGQIDVHKPFAAQVFDLLKSRRVKEWSFAYDVGREKKADDGANELLEVDVHEVGPCLKGANSETYTVSAKSALEKELKEAYDQQKGLSRVLSWQDSDPEVVESLAKAYGLKKPDKKEAKLYRVERRVPSYDGPYSLESADTFACVDEETGEAVDSHKTQEAADEHVKQLKAGEHLTDDAIEKALGKPWHIEKRGEQYCVIKDEDSSTVACHDTREDAEAQMRALYANEASGSADGEKEAESEETEEPEKALEIGDLFWSKARDGVLYENEVVETFADGTMASAHTGLKWDGAAAMAKCDSASDFRSIAFERDNDSDPDTAAHWALPHHPSPGAGPDKGGVSAAWGALHGSRGGKPALKNPSAAESHLSGHRSSLGLGDDDKSDTAVPLLAFDTSTDSGGTTTWTITMPDGQKIGRRIGVDAATALKDRLGEAVDAFVREINGQLEEEPKASESSEDKNDEPESAKEIAELNAKLDALLGEGDN